ncbi:hypothetical protein F5Y14DRAFT_455928, partial [Nemania sp. NC0429]
MPINMSSYRKSWFRIQPQIHNEGWNGHRQQSVSEAGGHISQALIAGTVILLPPWLAMASTCRMTLVERRRPCTENDQSVRHLKTIITIIIMLSFIALFGAALVAASPVLQPGTGSGTAPDPSTIIITSVSASGNGCPQGSVTTTLSPDREVVTFGFDKFQTYIGPGTVPADRTKNCQLHLNLKYPGGFQFAV